VPSIFPVDVSPANVVLEDPSEVIFFINPPLDTNKFPVESIAIPLPELRGEKKVETTCDDVIFLIALFVVSTTNTLPFVSSATESGELKLADVPVPFTKPELPEPAKVETV
jgi:hypothetical protein